MIISSFLCPLFTFLFISIPELVSARQLYELDLIHHPFNLYTSLALYDEESKEIMIYGHSHYPIQYLKLDDGINFEFTCTHDNGYRLQLLIKRDLHQWPNPTIKLLQIQFDERNSDVGQFNVSDVKLLFPFEDPTRKKIINSLDRNSATIATLSALEHDRHRLTEWLDYNLKLGFSSIIIFDNTVCRLMTR